MALEPLVQELATGPNFAVLTTLQPDGQPQSTITWVGTDGTHLLVNTERHFQKVKNAQRDPRVTLVIWDRQNPFRYAQVQGRVVEIVGGPAARAHIAELARTHGAPAYMRPIQTERVIPKVLPTRQVLMEAPGGG